MQDEVSYRCINAACAHPLPRVVNFCPYCGAPQLAGSVRPADAAPAARPAPAVPKAVVAPAATNPPAPNQVAPKPVAPKPVATAPPRPAPARAAPPLPAGPPARQPIRMRHWVIVMAVLSLIWMITKPDHAKKIDGRIDDAIALAQDCKLDAARADQTALKSASATREQLDRLQHAISAAASLCERTRPRARDAAAVKPPVQPPVQPPADAIGQTTQKIVAEAEQEIALGNYKGAIDKMEVCTTMIEGENKECVALAQKARRLNQDMLRCVAGGKEWISGRCE